MLAYRHAFHAGNHGDVLKHLVLIQVLRHLNLKDKGWRAIDTHAGAGLYALGSAEARKKAEFADGIGRLWGRPAAPGALADYLDLVRQFNPDGAALRRYPGSPALVQALMRPQDQLRLFERHPTDHRLLTRAMTGAPAVEIRAADGFTGLKSLLPPPTRRALVLIDPSYEGEQDYARVLQTLRDALGRFADGTYMVWYPQVGKLGAREMPRRLQALAPKGWLHARLTVARTDARGFGMAGSGVFVINPPHTLHAQLQAVLPGLAEALAQIDQPQWLLDHHAS